MGEVVLRLRGALREGSGRDNECADQAGEREERANQYGDSGPVGDAAVGRDEYRGDDGHPEGGAGPLVYRWTTLLRRRG